MSMLAEKKHKQKWHILGCTVNKNNGWSKDSNKYGQKMLEKMGWKEGKGLGRNEDGKQQYVKVAVKNNVKGVGFKDSVEWSVQQDNFHVLLEGLNKSTDAVAERETKSLEEKSQRSRTRVHYKKFTRGKDLSRYSEKDLANILGRKELKSKGDAKAEEGGGTASMVDYFKSKMPNFERSVKSEPEDHERPAFGFGYSGQNAQQSFVSYVPSEVPVTPKKRKDAEANDTAGTPTKKLKFEESPMKKPKSVGGLSNPAFEPLGNNITIKKHVLNTIKEEPNSLGENDNQEQDEKKSKVLDNPALEDDTSYQEQDNMYEVKRKKRKDKGKRVDNEGVENPSFEERKRLKKKKSKGLDNPALDLMSSQLENSSSKYEVKRKNKNKEKDSTEHSALDESKVTQKNKSQTTNEADESISSKISEHVEKKKKKKKSKGLDNPSLGDSIRSEASADNPSENYEVKREKKKKLKGIDNPVLNDSCGGIDNPTLCLNDSVVENTIVDKIKRKKSKTAHKGIDNPVLNDSCGGIDNPTLCLNDSVVENTIVAKIKRKKSKTAHKGVDNPVLNDSCGGIDNHTLCLNDSVVENTIVDKIKRKKSKTAHKGIDNPVLNDSCRGIDNPTLCLNDSTVENAFVAKIKKKSKTAHKGVDNPVLNDSCGGIDNPTLCLNDSAVENTVVGKIKKKKSKTADNSPANEVDNNESADGTAGKVTSASLTLIDDIACDIMLNVTDEPVKKTETTATKTSTESRRFSRNNEDKNKRKELHDINNAIIEASLNDQKSKNHRRLGIDNRAFNERAQTIEESVNSLARTIDLYQAEVENDINEDKLKQQLEATVEAAGQSDGEDEAHEEGVKLRYKNASFNKRAPLWQKRNDTMAMFPKKSYKHLIKSDIIVKFKASNLHCINGYGIKK